MIQWEDKKPDQESMDPIVNIFSRIQEKNNLLFEQDIDQQHAYQPWFLLQVPLSLSFSQEQWIRISRMQSFTRNLTSPGNALPEKTAKCSVSIPPNSSFHRLDLLLASKTNTKTTNLTLDHAYRQTNSARLWNNLSY